MTKTAGKRVAIIILIALMVLNAILSGCLQKKGFHLDEIYSFHFVCQTEYPSIHADRPEGAYLNTWHDVSYFEDYFTVSGEEAFDLSGTISSIKEDEHPPLFYLLLEITSSILGNRTELKWNGLIPNLVYFLAALVLFYLLLKRIMKTWQAVVAALCVYGFSVGAVSTVMYIRMYMLLALFSVLLAYANVRFCELLQKDQKTVKETVSAAAVQVAAMVGGLLTHYYFLVFAFVLCLATLLSLLLQKELKNACFYSAVSVGGAGLSFLIWPEIFHDLFRGARGSQAAGSLTDLAGLPGDFKKMIGIVNDEVFGKGLPVFLAIAVVAIIAAIVRKKRENVRLFPRPDRRTVQVILLAAVSVLCLLSVTKIAPYKSDRYIFNIFPFIVLCIVYLFESLFLTIQLKKPIVAAFCILCAVFIVLGYKTVGVKYLYPGTVGKIEKVCSAEKAPQIAVFADDCGNNLRMYNAKLSYYWRMGGPVYATKEKGLESLEKDCPQADRYIVYIDHDLSAEKILKNIMDQTEMSKQKKLFKDNYADAWLITK